VAGGIERDRVATAVDGAQIAERQRARCKNKGTRHIARDVGTKCNPDKGAG